ncbi:hypothetical protein BDV96DRAFT_184259 [Lophiotrema nucula]|uniref:2EXR domain-containing protein n=1 Tax=Lophiotrema nucula TaxID=690887 RepID=A0A6A5YXE0_9PLEO|nr:hypothetical protein BDV96DRAFT_184259 [Lophiotrema nucula]
MSQAQNQVTDIPRRQSKRKHVQINYYEGGSDIEDLDDADDGIDVFEESLQAQTKKRKTARPSRPLPKRKIFPFMKLPAEIRNMIYGYSLHDPRGIYLLSETVKYRRTVGRAPWHFMERIMEEHRTGNEFDERDDEEREQQRAQERSWWMKPSLLAPGLIAVNKQINEECRDILYGNDFHFGDTLALHSFMVNIGPRAASLVESITLRGWSGGRGMHKAYNHAAFAAMISATNIKKFAFKTSISWGGKPMWVARQLYRDSFPWLEAVGVAKGRFDAAVDLIELAEHNFEGYGWRRARTSDNPEEDKKQFREELSKLLGDHTKQVWSEKRPKKRVMDEM